MCPMLDAGAYYEQAKVVMVSFIAVPKQAHPLCTAI